MATTIQVETNRGGTVTALHYAASVPPAGATLVLAHGAGANQFSAFMTGMATGLSSRGLDVVTFNFPYTERGQKLPDPQPVLEESYRAVLRAVDAHQALGSQPLFIGGKSLGGRMASHLAAALAGTDEPDPPWAGRLRGLVLLGYPLHPPGRPQQIRVSHLPAITHPMLFVQGGRDAFGTPEELQVFTHVLPARCTLHAVALGGHSFEVPKRSGIAQDDVFSAAQNCIVEWSQQQICT